MEVMQNTTTEVVVDKKAKSGVVRNVAGKNMVEAQRIQLKVEQ